VVAGWPLALLEGPFGMTGAWTPDGNTAASAVAGIDAAGNQTIQVWLFAQPSKTELYEFLQPLTDCICRFGVPPSTLAFSADGQYLASGWPVGKGATPIRIYRVADASLVETLDITDSAPIWSRAGHRLFLAMSRSWTPEDGLSGQAGAGEWSYMAGLSPDGGQIAYTGYADAVSIRVYVYDIATGKTRMLIDQPRSEVTFVKDGWGLWYFEEAPCASCAGQSGPTDKVFAMNLANGVETRVVFAAGESPSALQSSWGPGQFWPNS